MWMRNWSYRILYDDVARIDVVQERDQRWANVRTVQKFCPSHKRRRILWLSQKLLTEGLCFLQLINQLKPLTQSDNKTIELFNAKDRNTRKTQYSKVLSSCTPITDRIIPFCSKLLSLLCYRHRKPSTRSEVVASMREAPLTCSSTS
jgi:hypothetical protein